MWPSPPPHHGVAEIKDHLWRKEFGGLKLDQMRWLKDLELKNSWLKKAGSELALDRFKLTEVFRESKQPLAPPASRTAGPFQVRHFRTPGVLGHLPATLKAAPDLGLAEVEEGLTAAVTV